MRLFYNHDVSSLQLSKEESAHALRVLRLSIGDKIHIVDGLGGSHEATITDTRQKICHFEVTKSFRKEKPDPYYIHIVIAPTKSIDRLQWMVEKCTEIGIDEITLIKTERSERKIVKLERLQKTAIQAMKQSLKYYLPKINPIQTFESFLQDGVSQEQKFVAHLVDEDRQSLSTLAEAHAGYCVLIGPEGDFSHIEVPKAIQHGYMPVTLGTKRLRTETAAVVACHSLHLINEIKS